jgi:azurin
MKLSTTICLLFASLSLCVPATASGQAKAAAGAAKGARTVNLTGSDAMKYDVTTIQAHPGETLHIVLKNVGSMPKIAMAHNVVVLKPGTDGTAFTNAGITSRDTEYIGPSVKAQVLAATQLAGAGETVELTFKVPAKRATYPFLCTFPGHFASGMHGTIVAK